MSGFAIGSVKSLYRFDDGYEVTVAVQGDGAGFSIEIRTPHDDPKEAIEAAREFLCQLGTDMAEAFKDPGSLD